MQRLGVITAALTILTLSSLPACSGKDDDTKSTAGDKTPATSAGADAGQAKTVDDTTVPPSTDAGAELEAGAAEAGVAAEAGTAEAGAADAGAADAGAAEAGTAEAGAADAGVAAEAGEAEAGAEDPVPALLEQVKDLGNDDATAQKALADALAAGGAKLDAAKAADARGEDLMTKGESERAEAFFIWARDAHNHYADPVYNLAMLAALAGDLEIAKEHLEELKKRGNKKLMRKVGVEPAFAPLHDDPDVRKIYEQ